MTLVEIKRMFEKRKFNLIRVLESGREEIDLSKQHQIYGAIKELENILKTIDYYQEMESESHFDFSLVKEPNKTLLQKITFKLKNNSPEAKTKEITVNETNE